MREPALAPAEQQKKFRLPPGFKIEVWVEGVPEARSLALLNSGSIATSSGVAIATLGSFGGGERRRLGSRLEGCEFGVVESALPDA